MTPSFPRHGGGRLRRRSFLTGMLAAVAAPAVVALPAVAPPPAALERAVAEVRACRFAELRHFGSRSPAARRCTGEFVLRTLRAVGRLRDAAASEGLSYPQYRTALNLALRLGRRDYLKEMPRPVRRALAA